MSASPILPPSLAELGAALLCWLLRAAPAVARLSIKIGAHFIAAAFGSVVRLAFVVHIIAVVAAMITFAARNCYVLWYAI